MTLRHMRIYLTVYQTENITKAAEALGMTQPAVTRAIQDIENYYGIRLFERINRRLHVTETGKVFFNYALHIVDSFDQMEKSLRDWDELGVLRVGTSVTIGTSLLPKVLTKFRKEHPALQIKSTISNGATLQQDLLDNRLDFAIIEGNINDESLCKEAIATDRLVLIMPPDDPRSSNGPVFLRDFEKDAFILREEGSMGRTLMDYIFEMHGIPLVPTMESISTQAIINAVHEGLGISFLPEHLVRSSIDSGFVATRELSDEKFIRNNYIVWHKHKFLTQSAKELMDYFRCMSYTSDPHPVLPDSAGQSPDDER